jgi:PPM family protein phosphatase
MNTPMILGGSGNAEYASGTTPSGLRFAARTDMGIEYKDWNEDRIVIAPDEGLFGVVDGMGGYEGGEIAAQLIAEQLRNDPSNPPQCFLEARSELERLFSSGSRNLKEAGGCVGTLSIDAITGLWRGFHAGDVKRLIMSNQHSFSGDSPKVLNESVDHDLLIGLTPEEARRNRFRCVVTKTISREHSDVEPASGVLLPGSMALLYDDGISDNIPVADMIRLAARRSVSELLEEVWRITTEKMEKYDENLAKTEPMKRDNRAFIAIEVP